MVDKLPQLSGKNIGRLLVRLEFILKSQKGSHMKYVREQNGAREVIIVPNHKVLRKGTLHDILKKIKKKVLKFNAVFLEEEDGGYSVSVPALSGCFSEGDSFEEAATNIKEAIELYLEDDKKGEDRAWLQYRSTREFLAPIELHG